ncbi:MAG: hypothetical protein OEZ38_09360, partial [Gammaproteobacteria bacterium]|nr:hypothetical protein [Gammaproteobacteria bacterium]
MDMYKEINPERDSLIDYVVRHDKLLMYILVVIFFVVTSGLNWYVSRQAENTVRDQKIQDLNSIASTTRKSIHEFWLADHLPELERWALDSTVIDAVQSLVAISLVDGSLANSKPQKILREYFVN